MKRFKSALGRKFNRLLILGQWVAGKGSMAKSYVLAQCDCGKLKEYRLASLKSEEIKSCGCWHRQRSKKFCEDRVTHAMSGSKAYAVWGRMIQRCTNPKNKRFKDYGGRGIKVCQRWLKFENFYEDMGDRPKGLQIDRIDNNKGYFKENCRWTTRKVNTCNKRTSKYWYLFGVRYNSSTEASKKLGVCPSIIKRWCDGRSDVSKAGVRYEYPPKPGCYSELKYG